MRPLFANAHWIGRPAILNDWRAPDLPAPYFRREFDLSGISGDALEASTARICGLGYFELHVNGQKADDRVLAPTPSVFDRHFHYVEIPMGGRLVPGVNAFGVVLGNGWYNCSTHTLWHFEQAPWRDYPKFILELALPGGQAVLVSDLAWRFTDNGPIRFDALRNGERHDARLELGDWACPGYDDAAWLPVADVPGPGGLPRPDAQPPCRAWETRECLRLHPWLWDAGQNLAGWARLTLRGNPGDEVGIQYSDNIDSLGHVDLKFMDGYVRTGEAQRDHYICRGGGTETWEPRFTYHGFRYVEIGAPPTVTVEKVEARAVGTDFAEVGRLESGNKAVNRLQSMTRWAYRSNFVGIPTDCPHREKNGWTGDALIAAETGLFNYDAGAAYGQWLDTLRDNQRPNGQLPGIAPSGGWGYNWGSGPAWDSAFTLIPGLVYAHTGERAIIERHYDAMLRYMDYCASRARGRLLDFGLGDWAHADSARMAGATVTSTAFHHANARAIASYAALLGRAADNERFSALAREIRGAFIQEFHRGDDTYAGGEMTSNAAAVHFGLARDPARTALRLRDQARERGHRADFGILGAMWAPRALAEHGYLDDAFLLLTQPGYPGWGHWIERGETTLIENWAGGSSRNHIMFGDISAWFFTYLGGFRPCFDHPGWRRPRIRPGAPAGLGRFRAEWRGYVSAWSRRRDGTIAWSITVPEGCRAELILPGAAPRTLDTGEHAFRRRQAPEKGRELPAR